MFTMLLELVQIASLITGMISSAVIAIIAYLMYRLKVASDLAAVKREKVGNELSTLTEDMSTVKKQTNGLLDVMKTQAEESGRRKGFEAGQLSEHDKQSS